MPDMKYNPLEDLFTMAPMLCEKAFLPVESKLATSIVLSKVVSEAMHEFEWTARPLSTNLILLNPAAAARFQRHRIVTPPTLDEIQKWWDEDGTWVCMAMPHVVNVTTAQDPNKRRVLVDLALGMFNDEEHGIHTCQLVGDVPADFPKKSHVAMFAVSDCVAIYYSNYEQKFKRTKFWKQAGVALAGEVIREVRLKQERKEQ
jgi:hypothetical protein